MATSQFNIPSTLIVGRGTRLQLAQQIQRLGICRVLIVTDRFMVESGRIEPFEKQLREEGILCAVFSEVQPDPTVKNVEEGLKAFQSMQAQMVVGIGGGSSMDAAKAIAVLTTNAGPLSQYMGYHKIPKPGCSLILIPTTAGTGSEATKVAVITDIERNVKMMILDIYLQATVAIVDFELSMSMPPTLTAHVGVDTLSHGIEAYVSRKANVLTDPIALSCIKLCGKYLIRAYQDGSDSEAREGMMNAALQGGIAFSNSSVCLIHGMSRPLGAHFHLTHGLSNAVLLPTVTQYSIDSSIARYADIARAIGVMVTDSSDNQLAKELVIWLEQLNKTCQIPPMSKLVPDLQTYESKLKEMAEAAVNSGSPANNPRIPTHEEIIQLYKNLW